MAFQSLMRISMRRFLHSILFVSAILVSCAAQAHILPGSYLRLTVEGNTIHGTWDLSLYSLAEMVEIQDRSERELQEFALGKLSIEADGAACKLHIDETERDGEIYQIPQIIHIAGDCPKAIARLTINYFSLLVIDPPFRGFVNVMANGQTYTSVLSAQNSYAIFQIGTAEETSKVDLSGTMEEVSVPDRWQQFKDYAREGVWHIWIGYDHILFLLSLLLTAAFTIQNRQWKPRPGLKMTFWQVTKIVTSFTLAHSITLGLVIFGVVSLSSQLVESTIALSIAVAAANNLYSVLHKRLWLLTFCFGLIHGMGFAGALEELGLPDNARWLALVGFNLGVEAGQLVIVVALLPVIYFLRHSVFYRKKVLPATSCLIIAVAVIWFIQRAFDMTLFGGVLGG
jgi:hypothetical protein